MLYVFWRGLVFLFNSFKTEFNAESITFATVTTTLCIFYAFGQSYRQNQQQKQALIQQRIQAELDALKAQMNPHFLFNSLNSVYDTAIVEDSPRTAESIQQLSGIVQYVMEVSRLQTTDVRRELRFIDDYVELQRVRIPNQENIQITTDIEWDEKPAQIMPLLLNPLIENAFKYGISIQYPCFVRIQLRVQGGTLRMTTENSILLRTDLEKGTGIGLANVRQRLELAYPGQHSLTMNETDDAFLVDLTIKL
ncbi:MAG: histidine kinase [Spirosoma sp.]|nr:histidine kinase [Spirosoma sp.]